MDDQEEGLIDVIETNDDDSLTSSQEKVLSLLPVVSGLLSAWGSLEIIRIVLLRGRQRTTPTRIQSCYQRIMLGLSASDLVSSIVLSLQAFLLPAAEGRTWALGNQATCNTMGFLQQLAGTTIFYNCMLSFVFLLTIRHGVTEARLSAVYEPWMHTISIGFPLVTACIAFPWYGPVDVGQFCWISGKNSAMVAYIVAGIPYFLIIIIISVNNISIYHHERRQTLEKRRTQVLATLELAEGPPTSLEKTVSLSSSDRHDMPASLASSSHDCTTFSNEQTAAELHDERRRMARRQASETRRRQRLKKLAWQAFYYVTAFLATQLPAVTLRVWANVAQVKREDEASLFVILVLQAVLWPLQGLFNYLIYTQTAYVREIG